MSLWHRLITEWRGLEPRQQRIGKIMLAWLAWFELSTAWRFIAPPQPPRPWTRWATLPAGVFFLFLLYVGRRSTSYTTWRSSMRPQDLPRFDQLIRFVPPLLVASMIARLALDDGILSRVVGLPFFVVSAAATVLAAGGLPPQTPKRRFSLPWPFNVSPRVPPDTRDVS